MQYYPTRFVWFAILVSVSGVVAGGLVWWQLLRPMASTGEAVQSLPPGKAAGIVTSVTPAVTPLLVPLLTVAPTNFSVRSTAALSSVPIITSPFTPTSTPTPTLASTLGLQNAEFDQDLLHWQTQGVVQVFPALATDHAELPVTLNHYVRLSSAASLDWLGAHQLSQVIQLPAEANTLEFWFRVWTEETELGFDNPCLVVLLNQQPVLWLAATLGWSDTQSPPWHLAQLPLPAGRAGQVTLRFLAGQTGDQVNPTWVDLTGLKFSAEPVSQPVTTGTQLQLQLSTSGEVLLNQQPPEYFLLPDFPGLLEPMSQPQLSHQLSLLAPERGLEWSLLPFPWSPDGTTFQPSVQAPDFWPISSALYQPVASPQSLLETLHQHAATAFYVVVKTLQNQAQQLLPVDVHPE